MWKLTLIAGLAVLLPASAFCQTATGDILGNVTDASGAAVTDAKVTAKNLDTNATKEMTTSGLGTFRISLLPSGSYEVTVEKPGFAKYVQGLSCCG